MKSTAMGKTIRATFSRVILFMIHPGAVSSNGVLDVWQVFCEINIPICEPPAQAPLPNIVAAL